MRPHAQAACLLLALIVAGLGASLIHREWGWGGPDLSAASPPRSSAGAWAPPTEPIPGERLSLSEALDRAQFELLAPSVIPAGLELAGVWYSSDGGRATAYLVYAPGGLEVSGGVTVPEVILSGGMVIVGTYRPNLPPEAPKSLMEGFRRLAGSHLRDTLELLAERNPAAPWIRSST